MNIYIVNNRPFKTYKAADCFAQQLRIAGQKVQIVVEYRDTLRTKYYAQQMRVKGNKNTWNKKINA